MNFPRASRNVYGVGNGNEPLYLVAVGDDIELLLFLPYNDLSKRIKQEKNNAMRKKIAGNF